MKLFNFSWFNSKEREQLKKENSALQERISALEEKVFVQQADTPYKNIFYSGNIITVVFHDGDILSVPDVDSNTYSQVRLANTRRQIEAILTTPEQAVKLEDRIETVEERKTIKDNLHILRNIDEFEIRGEQVFLKGVKLPMPAMVVSSFLEIIEKKQYNDSDELDEQYEALRSFWIKLALNSLEQSRTDLLRFVKENDVQITRNGNLVLYRRIVSLGNTNKDLVRFVGQEYYKIKKWKKSPKNFFVYQDNGKYICKHIDDSAGMDEDIIVGNLYDLYKDSDSLQDNEFTSYHNRGQHTIKIGQVYKIDESGINLNNGLCAAGGLHAAAVNYDYSGFGDTPVVVLVNPSKTITVPTGETGKLRTTEMFIVCINDKKHGEHFEEDTIMHMDDEYNEYSIEELEEAIKNKDFTCVTVENKVESPNTILDLANIKDLLKNRVNVI